MTVEPHAVENLINRLSSLAYWVTYLVCSQLAYDKRRLMSKIHL